VGDPGLTRATHRRLTRYALYAAVHGAMVVIALTGVLGTIGGVVVLVAFLPLLLAWGTFQADIALNPALDEVDRTRWRIALWCLPWSMTAYWYRHVRAGETF